MLIPKNTGLLALYPVLYFQQAQLTSPSTLIYQEQAYQNDPYLNYVVLNVNGNSTTSSNNNTFLDSNSANLTITNLNTVQGSFTPFDQNKWSGFFDGTGYLTISDNAAFDLGTGDFTVEAWYYNTSTGDQRIIGSNTSGSFMFGSRDVNSRIAFGRSGAAWDVEANTTFPINQWAHVAYVRRSNNGYIYLNGRLVGGPTSITSFSYNLLGSLLIGADGATYFANGYISNVRIIKGLALYTTDFTPPIDKLSALTGTGYSTVLLALQDGYYKDNSSNNWAITPTNTQIRPFNPFKRTNMYTPSMHGGSGFFDGTARLTVPTNTAFSFGTGDFTVECYVYMTNAAMAYPTILEIGNHANTNAIAFWLQQGANNLKPQVWSNSSTAPINTPSLTLNSWNHVVWQRTSGNLRIYVNGVGSNTIAFTNNLTDNSTVSIGYPIGNNGGANYWYKGYISNLHIVKGLALYTTATFTPPKSPVVSINQTSLLLNFTNSNVYDTTSDNVINTVGTARTDSLSSAVLSSARGCLYFDGTSNMVVPNNPDFNFSTNSPFTIECWVNKVANGAGAAGTGAYEGILSFCDAAPTANAWGLYINQSDNRIAFFNGSSLKQTSVPISNSTWNHIAVVRNATNLVLFVNGVSSYNQANAEATNSLGRNLIIGWDNSTGANQNYKFNGYIDDIRVTKGVARYTSNFNPNQTYENATYDVLSNITVTSLLVGGGGAGGWQFSGGGGAGGVLLSSVNVPLSATYSITIGAGGTAGTSAGAADKATAQNGKNTLFYNLTAIGGGSGADDSRDNAQNGGSGGGASYNNNQAGSSLFGQGFSGGRAPSENNFAGGGGGSGEAGDTDGLAHGGDGTSAYSNILTIVGAGVESGGLRYIAGGGAGWSRGTAGAAGLGGGGDGFVTAGTGAGVVGVANTGGGGGGSGGGNAAGGGSGIAILQTSDEVMANVTTTNASKVFNENKVYYKYLTNGTLTTITKPYTTVYVIAGGGGGAGSLNNNGCGGGGGAGGTIIAPIPLADGTYTITVGAGGAGGVNQADGTNGTNTSFGTGVGGLTAFGGGGGGTGKSAGVVTAGNVGKAGGCGGGGGYYGSAGGAATSYTTLSVITTNTNSQGFSGGAANTTAPFNGGGGGGAARSGGGGTSYFGGSGFGINLIGHMEYYAGGGGGGAESGTSLGGLGGGGNGGIGSGVAGSAGGLCTGGGGGGGGGAGGSGSSSGGAGGRGVVIVKQPNTQSRYFITGADTAIQEYNNFVIYRFYNNGTLTVPVVEYYVVGGGGGGGGIHGGGGGAGSVIYGKMFDRNLTVGTYNIIIGSGGSGGSAVGSNGGNTIFGPITAFGGGGGGSGFSTPLSGKSGGSGGGGGASTSVAQVYNGGAYLSGFGDESLISVFGNVGGNSYGGGVTVARAGGGGGAGGAGTNTSTTQVGNGGAGINILGLGFFAAGGGGGSDQAGDSTGGSSIGGNGKALAVGTAGANNTGSGGGGGGGNSSSGGAGGTGVFIISVVTAANPIKSYTGNPIITTSGSNTIYRFNSNGTITI